MRKFQSNRILF